jgi:hypothetical protein
MINPWNVGCVGENPNFGFFFYFFFKKEANLGFSPTHPTRKKTIPEDSQKTPRSRPYTQETAYAPE